MRFEMTHLYFDEKPKVFTEVDAPVWLTSANTVKGSTMDNRWFWELHIFTLSIGESIETDFRKIMRVA